MIDLNPNLNSSLESADFKIDFSSNKSIEKYFKTKHPDFTCNVELETTPKGGTIAKIDISNLQLYKIQDQKVPYYKNKKIIGAFFLLFIG